MTLEQKITKLFELVGAAKHLRASMLQLHVELNVDGKDQPLVVVRCFSKDTKDTLEGHWAPTLEGAIDDAIAANFTRLQKKIELSQAIVNSFDA